MQSVSWLQRDLPGSLREFRLDKGVTTKACVTSSPRSSSSGKLEFASDALAGRGWWTKPNKGPEVTHSHTHTHTHTHRKSVIKSSPSDLVFDFSFSFVFLWHQLVFCAIITAYNEKYTATTEAVQTHHQ